MPHQCTTCGRTFPDGSKEMLSGCPDCGGNKFQFQPAGAADTPQSEPTESKPAQPDPTGRESTQPDPTQGESQPPEPTGSEPGRSEPPRDAGEAGEDGAQASARSDVVSKDEIAAASEPPADTSDATGSPAPAGDTADTEDDDPVDPNLDALRRKLNDQFESIRIVSPGQYELNLMELYDREEYIISLREDGRYVIEMPEGWDDR